MPNTYTELRKTTVGTATSSVTLDLTGISGYTDLIVVASLRADTVTFNNMNYPLITYNGDTGTNYSITQIFERYYGSQQTLSDRASNGNNMNMGPVATTSFGSGIFSNYILQVLNYSNTTTYKTCLSRISTGGNLTDMQGSTASVGLWRNTNAITSITFTASSSGNFVAGCTLSVYGIANADQGAAKATGGIITEDSQYWYHTFGASGAFVPKQNLTCDYLVIAGGGGGYNAGGGAGGLRSTVTATGGGGTLETPLSLLASTNYTVTIGAGGPNGNNGVNSTFATITATGGGAGSGGGFNAAAGGSGGGGSWNGSIHGADGTTNQGYAGGNGTGSGNNYGGGGGGAGGSGGNVTGAIGGSGGAGVTITALATTTGTGVSGAYAGGGGGSYNGGTGGSATAGGGAGQGSAVNGINGVANTGGGAGATIGAVSYGVGGSGLVIVRYAK
jgi:hypothetical protein